MTDLADLVRSYLEAYDRARQPPAVRLGRSYRESAEAQQDRYLSRDRALDRLRQAVKGDDDE